MVRDTIWVVFMKATEFDQTRRRPRTVLEQICRHQKHRCLPDAIRVADYFDAIPRAFPAQFYHPRSDRQLWSRCRHLNLFFKQPQTFLNSRFSNLVNFVSAEFKPFSCVLYCICIQICDKDGNV